MLGKGSICDVTQEDGWRDLELLYCILVLLEELGHILVVINLLEKDVMTVVVSGVVLLSVQVYKLVRLVATVTEPLVCEITGVIL